LGGGEEEVFDLRLRIRVGALKDERRRAYMYVTARK
jgi:hypothetical protein